MIRKTNFFEGCSWFKSNNLGLALGIILKLYTGVAKGLKLKVRNFWGNSYVCRSYKGKTGRRPFCPPILNMFNTWHSSLGFLALSDLNKKCCKVRKTQANQSINKVIKVTSRASYYLIFTLFHKTFRKH